MRIEDTILRTSPRDVRASWSPIGLGGSQNTVANAETFADSILGRYVAFGVWTEPVERTLRRTSASDQITNRAYHTHVNLAPQLELTVVKLTQEVVPEFNERAQQDSPRWESNRETLVTRIGQVEHVLRRDREVVVPWETIVQQVQLKTERRLEHELVVESGSERMVRMPGTREIVNAPETAATYVHKPTADKVYRRERQSAEIKESWSDAPLNPVREVQARQQPFVHMPDAKPVNVDQLADQVIKVIDQRIISQRERFGHM